MPPHPHYIPDQWMHEVGRFWTIPLDHTLVESGAVVACPFGCSSLGRLQPKDTSIDSYAELVKVRASAYSKQLVLVHVHLQALLACTCCRQSLRTQWSAALR